MTRQRENTSAIAALLHLMESRMQTEATRDEVLAAYLTEGQGKWLSLLERGRALQTRDEANSELRHYLGLAMFEDLKQAVTETLNRNGPPARKAKEIFEYILAYRRFVFPVIEGKTWHSTWEDTQFYMLGKGYLADFPDMMAKPEITERIQKLAGRTLKTYRGKRMKALAALQRAVIDPRATPSYLAPVNPLQELKRLGH